MTSNPSSPDDARPGPDPFAGARTFLVALSRTGRVERIAERALLDWGFRATDAVDLDFADAPWWRDVPETRARIAAGVARARDGEPMHGTVRLVTAGGESRELVLTFDPIGGDGAIDSLLVTGMDVTSLRRETRDSIDGSVHAADAAAWRVDLATGRVEAEPGRAGVYGLSDEEAATATSADYLARIHPEDAPRVARAQRRAIETGGTFESTFRVRTDTGTRWLVARGEAERDADGKRTHLAGVTLDITPQRAATEALERSEIRYRRLFETTEEGYCVFEPVRDADGALVDVRYAEVNPAFEHHTGLVDVEGRLMLGEVMPALEPHWLEAMRGVIDTGEPVRMVETVATIGRWIEASLVRLEDPAGPRLACMFRDVTERREAEERRGDRARELAAQDERKNAFLATLAHELRNPLAPLAHALQLLEGGAGETAERAALHRMMDRQVTQLAHLVDDLLDVSRISSDKLTLRESTIELETLLEDAIETSRPLIDERGHALRVHLPAKPVRLRGDPVRLIQVLSNLLTNAARYTDEGGCLEVHAGADDGGVRVAVRDDGAGLDESSRERIFEMFTQVPADGTPREAFGGLGLGLTLARRLIELHGGEIEVDSAGLGRGSTFTVALPASRLVAASAPGAAPATAGAATDVIGLAVAVVDDNRDAADALATILRRRGCTVEVGYDGATALALVREGAPDVLILDIGLPDVSGHEVAERLVAEGTGTMLVALTGWGTEQDVERGRAAGFEHHLTKPARASAVLALLADAAAAMPERRPGR